MMMVDHLGKLALSSTAISISLCAIYGFKFGMSCALETLGGQAYGAKQYTRFGVQIYTCIVTLSLACVPMKFSTQCEKTRAPITMELFHGLGEFLCYAVLSDGMIWLVSSSRI
ncbi:hypothetical protein S245_055199 [Arachis hypogaea]